jgi:signal transduction histidine kinase
MIARLTAIYLAIFAAVLAAISVAAYAFVGVQYRSLLGPALQTAEAQSAYAHAMQRVALALAGFDLPLLVIVGAASYVLARVSVAPLLEARAREREFSIDVAHELRSPLATIASVAQIAGADADERTRRRLDVIVRAALDAGSLIGDLLTLARDPRPAVLHREPVDLANVVTACTREFDDRFHARGVTLATRAESCIVDGDERRLRELVRNLLENALRHARAQVSVSTTPDGGAAHITVEDDGSGIPPDKRDRLFDRYHHSDDGGIGLGLAIVAWIANAHEGSVRVETPAAGKGTAIVTTLPALRT